MSGSGQAQQGFLPVLTNKPFRALWMAQLVSQISQHAIHFVQMVLVEQLTHSAVLQGLVILCFTLPGVIFSPVAGVVVDRFSKKTVLVASNLIRVLLAASYIIVLTALHGTWQLLAIYAITFTTATLAQFFAPAEAATIPLLVGEERLMAANSLFNLTMAMSQVTGLLLLGPLIVSLLGYQNGFIIIAAMYLGATVLTYLLPQDANVARPLAAGVSRWLQMWEEVKEGWQFVSTSPRVKTATTHMVTINTLVMVLAMIAPGFAARVLGIAAENAVIVFLPAGVGMLLATGLVGRWGHWLRRIGSDYAGLVLVGLAFAALGAVSLDYQRLMQPILSVYPHLSISLMSATMVLALLLGLALSGVNILAQTTIQEDSPAYIRGRVFSVLFMLNALVGIPPMLALGEIADRIGIPKVLIIAGLCALVVAGASLLIGRGERARALPAALRRMAAPSHDEPAARRAPEGDGER